ncbi:MAG: 2-oxoacid:acceptor oxidoreductase family protein [Myxococcota bacterium]
MADRKEVRLAGAGTHGMIEAGLILQVAAAIYDDKNAHHVQSYGPEARSEAARSEVIISDGDIDYPKATQVNAFVATTQAAFERYSHDLKTDALVVVDTEVDASAFEAGRLLKLPLVETAERTLGKPALLPIIALGALVELDPEIVTKPALEAAVKDHVPRGGEELHIQALETGYGLAKQQ